MTKKEICNFFKDLMFDTDGIQGWLSEAAPDDIFDRLDSIERNPLTKVQLNQLLLLSLEAGISDDFFEYYWLKSPHHSYPVDRIEDFDPSFVEHSTSIISLAHLRWGIRRIYTDSLLYFGNIKFGFRELKNKNLSQLTAFFKSKSIPTDIIKKRGKPLDFIEIARDDRYLISEMACKTYGDTPQAKNDLREFLKEAYKELSAAGKKRITFKDLLSILRDDNNKSKSKKKYQSHALQFEFSIDEILDNEIINEADLLEKYERIADKFFEARKKALKNTELYLSLVNDLDVYVATSMRSRNDFREMADNCDKIFSAAKLNSLHLRYFDPTLSAADGHEDKGLIECLMVKCAKVLVYCAGDKESYGKDAEAAMSLSLGKPVIFFCNPQTRADFYKTVHPLSRLIDFTSGVAVGAIVTEKLEEVSELLFRIFENQMEYEIEQPKPGYFRLKEKLTQSIVRLQTNYELLSKSFWTYYHTKHEVV